LEIGLGKLGIQAGEFWKLTLREFWATYYGRFGREQVQEPMDKDALAELMRKFPDGDNP